MSAHQVASANFSARDVVASLDETEILHGITLTAASGTVVGLLGPNGSGKSTLLRTFFRSLTPDRGEVRLDGEQISTWTTRQVAKRVAVVLQDMPAGFPLTSLDVVKMGRAPHKRALDNESAADMAICHAAISIMNVQALEDKPLTQMSGGERQRVLIARALAQQPEVLLMDEPTNHLDLHHQLELLSIVGELGVTTIVALHDLNLASMFCDQLALLKSGHLEAFGTPDEVITKERVRQIYMVDAEIIPHPVTGRPYVIPL